MEMELNTIFEVRKNMDVTRKAVPYFSHCFELNDFQENIVMNLADHILLTYEMMYECFAQKGIRFDSDGLKRELRNLSDNEYLTELRIMDLDSDTVVLTVYTLGRRGLGWLKTQNRNVCFIKHCISTYTNDPKKIIKLLAANNLMIHAYPEQSYAIGKMFSADKSKAEENKKKGRLFRSYVSFKRENGGRSIIEPVRKENDGMSSLLEKLDRIQKVAVCSDSNLDLNQDNQVILIAEDSGHAAEIIRALGDASYRGFCVKVTSDTDVFDDMVSYIQVTQKKRESFWRILFAA